MLKAIIIDDEINSIKSLKWELQNFSNKIEIVDTFTAATAAIKYLKTNEVDCVFLDIEMPEMDGFQFLDALKERPFSVVITTAYDQYAIKAIKERTLDYLLKPIDFEDLDNCLKRLEDTKNKEANNDIKQVLDQLVESNNSFAQNRISVQTSNKLIFFDPDTIICCKSEGNYCYIFFDHAEKLFVTQQLKDLEKKLTKFSFYRIHNSYLINLNKIKEYHRSDDYVVLTNQMKIPVSRQKKAKFLEKL